MSSASSGNEAIPGNIGVFLHRMAQPATAILGYLELLLRDNDMTPSDRQRMLANCHASARQMHAILDSWHLVRDADRMHKNPG
jgi:signal transduction histidine kinase